MKAENLFDIKGKTALVTGATGGLGAVFARALAENGCTVIVNGRSKEKTTEFANQLNQQNFKAFGVAFDVSNSKEVEDSVAKIFETVGPVDILVNNAGINIRGPLEDYHDEDWDATLAINLTGAFKVSKAVVKGMIKQNSGKIINIGSMQSELGRPTIAPYAASKGGIKMLTKGMAVDWAKYNIQVNGIGPGYFKTELTKSLYENPEFDAWLCNRTPMNRWGNPEELVGALLFLSSDASNYVNGQMIYVDGGLLSAI